MPERTSCQSPGYAQWFRSICATTPTERASSATGSARCLCTSPSASRTLYAAISSPRARLPSSRRGGEARTGAELLALAGLAPPLLHSVLARSSTGRRLFNLTVTNVPGPPKPLYAFGARLEEVLPLVPLAADHAVGIAVVSYCGRVFFGLNGDARAVPDLDVLRDGIEESVRELRSAARRATELVR